MDRLLYENSVSYRGHLLIPYIYGVIGGQPIYSYKLLSELGHQGKLHKADNPSSLHSSSLEEVVAIAKEYLDEHSDIRSSSDYFKGRYTYRNHLIIVYNQAEKYFYDHYRPNELNNIAAPRIFRSEPECLSWIKQGFDRHHPDSTLRKPSAPQRPKPNRG
jgi:hypothetical protein